MNLKKFLTLLLITSVSLMAVALYNGFPLVDNDSGAYIEQAIYSSDHHCLIYIGIVDGVLPYAGCVWRDIIAGDRSFFCW